jgi:hypothetical protein
MTEAWSIIMAAAEVTRSAAGSAVSRGRSMGTTSTVDLDADEPSPTSAEAARGNDLTAPKASNREDRAAAKPTTPKNNIRKRKSR